ncbi:PTS lactose/cellobiose transporter subunit IIA [Bifidobacterium miconisargentati]|uniref:PTS lactose/cellobiose transporter subunit IIA n=1 Tax=Bifidobacterium miconisargentati TaxID=2834437 RepID=UPI001BDD6DF5|nr:PTS lactose/cellobiose transporter subunit IIA [Bifidobacterium miconisargentati]MBW3091029.1 PTS lactose/cellobiose transporter subunit IIA [Bifidobacterium miconisargentati]
MAEDNKDFDWETLCFQMITAAGSAKSDYIEALQAAKAGKYDKADELIKSGDQSFAAGHDLHTNLVQREAAGEKIEVSLLMTHVEDQMMAAETVKLLVNELIALYKKIN